MTDAGTAITHDTISSWADDPRGPVALHLRQKLRSAGDELRRSTGIVASAINPPPLACRDRSRRLHQPHAIAIPNRIIRLLDAERKCRLSLAILVAKPALTRAAQNLGRLHEPKASKNIAAHDLGEQPLLPPEWRFAVGEGREGRPRLLLASCGSELKH
jgi:hypothetical protein